MIKAITHLRNTLLENQTLVYRIEHKDTRDGVQTQLQAKYDHGELGWTLIKNPSIDEVIPEFTYGMKCGCCTLLDLADWYPSCLYMIELMRRHELILAVYLIEGTVYRAKNQCCWHPENQTLVYEIEPNEYRELYYHNIKEMNYTL